jgi:hypothetical protein
MAEKISIQNSYSKVNEALMKLFDESGVRRTFTVPYVKGQSTADHIASVGQAATQSGGLTANMITSAHHSDGKGWGSEDGHTVAHPTQKLQDTIIPKNDENAKAVIVAAQTHLNNIAKFVGDKNPAIVTANSQLGLLKPLDGAGMNLFDFGGMIIQVLHRPTQELAKAHDKTKAGGPHPKLRAPSTAGGPKTPPEGAGEPQPGGQAPEPSEAAPEAPAPVSVGAPGPPATPVAQAAPVQA